MCWRYRVESLRLERRDSRAKLAGITLCCAGAILMTFYRGPPLIGWPNPPVDVALKMHIHDFALRNLGITGWKFGAVCLVGNCLCMASYINLQVRSLS